MANTGHAMKGAQAVSYWYFLNLANSKKLS